MAGHPKGQRRGAGAGPTPTLPTTAQAHFAPRSGGAARPTELPYQGAVQKSFHGVAKPPSRATTMQRPSGSVAIRAPLIGDVRWWPRGRELAAPAAPVHA